jgi:hypothetical protein
VIFEHKHNHKKYERERERERERLLSRYVAREVESKSSSGAAQDIELILL